MRSLALIVLLAACQASPEFGSTTQALTSVSPTSHDFGSVQVGSVSADSSFSVNPGPNANSDTVTAVTENCPDFEVTAEGLPADVYRTCLDTCGGQPQIQVCPTLEVGNAPVVCNTDEFQSYTFTARFRPTVAQPSSCVVSIVIDGGSVVKTISLSGTGTSPPVLLDAQPKSMNFGQVHVGTASSAIMMNLHNAGGAAMAITNFVVIGKFVVGGPSSYNVAAGSTVQVPITCSSPALGGNTGTLSFNSNDPSQTTTNIPLSCTGINSAMSISPSPAALPTTRVGEPTNLVVTIGNSGSAPLALQSLAFTGEHLTMTGDPGAVSLPPGASTAVTVTFDATAPGDASGMLTGTFDGGQTNAVAVSAHAAATSLSLTPDGDVDFGPVCAGQNKIQTFTVVANAEGGFQVSGVSAPDAPFSIAGKLPLSVAGAGASQGTFTATVAPTAEGHLTSSFTLTTDIPNDTPHVINLAVDALPAGVTPSPATLDFGSNPLETTTLGQVVHLSNCDTAPVGWSNARIVGANASEFAIVLPPSGSTVPGSGSADWLIVLDAHSVGIKDAQFAVDYDGGTATVLLAGEGLGDLPGGGGGGDDTTTPGDKNSYYSCGVSRGGAAWPVGLALALLAFKRRSGK